MPAGGPPRCLMSLDRAGVRSVLKRVFNVSAPLRLRSRRNPRRSVVNDADTRGGGLGIVVQSLRPAPPATDVAEIEVDPRRAVVLAPVGHDQERCDIRRSRLNLRIDDHSERPICEFPAELVDEGGHGDIEHAAVTAIWVAGLDRLDNRRDTDRALWR